MNNDTLSNIGVVSFLFSLLIGGALIVGGVLILAVMEIGLVKVFLYGSVTILSMWFALVFGLLIQTLINAIPDYHERAQELEQRRIEWLTGTDLKDIVDRYLALEQSQTTLISQVSSMLSAQRHTRQQRDQSEIIAKYRASITALEHLRATAVIQAGVTWKARVIQEMYIPFVVEMRNVPKKEDLPRPNSDNPARLREKYLQVEEQLRSTVTRLTVALEENAKVTFLFPKIVPGKWYTGADIGHLRGIILNAVNRLSQDVLDMQRELQEHFSAHVETLKRLADEVRFLADMAEQEELTAQVLQSHLATSSLPDAILAVDESLDELVIIQDWTLRMMASAEIELASLGTAYDKLEDTGVSVVEEIRAAQEITSLLRRARSES